MVHLSTLNSYMDVPLPSYVLKMLVWKLTTLVMYQTLQLSYII